MLWIQIDEKSWVDISKFTAITFSSLGQYLFCFVNSEKTEYKCDQQIVMRELERVGFANYQIKIPEGQI